MVFFGYLGFPVQCRSTVASYTLSYTRCPYEEDRQAKSGKVPKSNDILEIGNHWTEECSYSFRRKLWLFWGITERLNILCGRMQSVCVYLAVPLEFIRLN